MKGETLLKRRRKGENQREGGAKEQDLGNLREAK